MKCVKSSELSVPMKQWLLLPCPNHCLGFGPATNGLRGICIHVKVRVCRNYQEWYMSLFCFLMHLVVITHWLSRMIIDDLTVFKQPTLKVS